MELPLERDEALAELRSCWRQANSGSGRVALVRGEAGVGKTTLIARFLAGIKGETRVLRGWCDALATPRPLGPLIDFLAGDSSEHAARLLAAIELGDRNAIYSGLATLFGGPTSCVCVIEDAHWSDGATLDVLRFLIHRIDVLPLLLVVSFRDDEVGPAHPLTVLLGDVASWRAISRIELNPLSAAAVAELSSGSGINADQLYELTGGNPFFVTEVLAAGPDSLHGGPLPHSVAEAVAGRLARLSAAAREAVQAAAVCGSRSSTALLVAVCRDAVVALPECLDSGVLVDAGGAVRFRHELARRATLAGIPGHRRQLLHSRVLSWLSKPPVDPNMLAAMVFHADQAGDVDAVVRHGPAAAARASALGAHREAAELYALVLRHAHALPSEQRIALLEQHSFSSYVSGLTDTSVEWLREAIALRHTLGDELGEGENQRWLSQMLYLLGRTSEAFQIGRTALSLLENGGPTTQLAWSLVNMAELCVFTYDPACADYADRALAMGRRLDDSAIVMRSRCSAPLAAVACSDTGWDELDSIWREAMISRGLSAHAGVAGVMLCWFAALHHHPRADSYVAEAAAFCLAHDLGAFHGLVTGSAAVAALHHGDWAHALACADDVLTRRAMSPAHRTLPLIAAALVRARRGDPTGGPLLDEALAAVEPNDLFRMGPVRAARAEASWLAGDDAAARAEAHSGLMAVNARADPWLVGNLRRWARLAGDPATPLVTQPVTPFDREGLGDWRGAADEWSQRGSRYDAAIAQLDGDVEAVQTALDVFRGLGARAAVRRAQDRLAKLRGRVPAMSHGASVNPHGLTRRQYEVLALLAAGHSDSEIAAALHISPKTANTHVCAILTKLGVHNRRAAARAYKQGGVTNSPA
ncbi:LuxR family transcriptional regulator [Mycolicibacterium sp. CBMA 226]|uniref:helix-turn-helix transcriptional regulator n=1 Tax=Mycolicibacterium sp. CBMA 226 TaxID=2606611 RepID=UPI00130B98FE|nr:LuxR family transcriptional regulator [Mycolicibacterium sp. CBMA 226]MUL76675.1 AAA family ATPase [Mycolicibacterium sp. CBMA 226]